MCVHTCSLLSNAQSQESSVSNENILYLHLNIKHINVLHVKRVLNVKHSCFTFKTIFFSFTEIFYQAIINLPFRNKTEGERGRSWPDRD